MTDIKPTAGSVGAGLLLILMMYIRKSDAANTFGRDLILAFIAITAHLVVLFNAQSPSRIEIRLVASL